MQAFAEAEIQALIACLELTDPKETPNNNFYRFYPKTLDEAGTYFRKFRLGWAEANCTLAAKGLMQPCDGGYQLTPAGVSAAQVLRDARPPIYYWYREYFSEAPFSPAYTRFCERLYGRALCQANFSDMQQMHTLLEAAQLTLSSRVLDLGCGVGWIAEYISDATGAHVTGMDYVPEAIEQAAARTAAKKDRLAFRVGNLDELPFKTGAFDTLISIDTLYMPNDLDRTLAQMCALLVPGGQMLIFYMQMLWGTPGSRQILQAEHTPLGEALSRAGLDYHTWDFSAQTYAHMQRKHQIGQSMQAEFQAEGRQFLYDNIMAESESSQAPYDPETCALSRYLYQVKPQA